MVDLRTRYMGLELAHPIVASASPLSKSLDGIRRLEDHGAAAVVMFSLFEEQIRREGAALDRLTSAGSESFAESLSYFPDPGEIEVGPSHYLDLLRRARAAVRIPVIASLNGTTSEGWVEYAKTLEQAGASAIELNVYEIPADPNVTGAEIEQRTIDVLRAVKSSVAIPVAIKLAPFWSAFANMAKRLDEAGADALVVFNRLYQPDFDLERREVVPSLELSTSSEMRLPLLWLAILHGKVRASLAATTGVHAATDVVKYLAAGADVTMTTSALLQQGSSHVRTLLGGLTDWLVRHDYASVGQLRGSMSQRKVSDPSAFERANYLRILEGYAATGH
ncbi:MAG: dihydroorotate dehydrogenase-like protein [Deltaproteobacteria bacterium]|nr:dihydroorotate dehydrogenase-like protein [Deltaproteobacteria bacterium]